MLLPFLIDLCLSAGEDWGYKNIKIDACIALVCALQKHSALRCVVLGDATFHPKDIVRSTEWGESGLPPISFSVACQSRNWISIFPYVQQYLHALRLAHCCRYQHQMSKCIPRALSFDVYPAPGVGAAVHRYDVTLLQRHQLLCNSAHLGVFIQKILPKHTPKRDPRLMLLQYISGAAQVLRRLQRKIA